MRRWAVAAAAWAAWAAWTSKPRHASYAPEHKGVPKPSGPLFRTERRHPHPKQRAERTCLTRSPTTSPRIYRAVTASLGLANGRRPKPRASGARPPRRSSRSRLRDLSQLSRSQAREIFEMALGEVADALTRGESVKLRSFGLFTVRDKARADRPQPAHRRRSADQAAPRADIQTLPRAARSRQRARTRQGRTQRRGLGSSHVADRALLAPQAS